MTVATTEAEPLWEAVTRHGRESVSFQTLKPGIEIWIDETTGALMPYADTGRAWVAAGLPLAALEAQDAVARRFAAAGAAAGRRVSWFAAERQLDGCRALHIGEQPEWDPADWPATRARARSLREQLRRARAAGVSARAVPAAELAEGSPLRASIDAIARGWLARRRMEPLGFLVTLAPWRRAEAHRYFVATREGAVVGFLSLVPIPARRGWLFEDLLRAPDAPNGTTELLIDLALRVIADAGAEVATLGLAPLGGAIGGWLRVARAMGRGLYDFRGLRAFKARLRPARWKPVWLLVAPGVHPIRAVLDVLRAFTGRHVGRFAARTVLGHPSAACVTLALPLVPWTLALGLAVLLGAHGPLGFSRGALGAWTLFDAALDAALWLVALRPRRAALAALAAVASADAVASVQRLLVVGWGAGPTTAALRAAAVTAPVVGAALLWWSARGGRGGSGGGARPQPMP